jgi:hypothetical protein
VAGATDLFSGSTALSGTNLFNVDKNPLQQLDQGIQDVIGQHGQNIGNSIFQGLNSIIDLILGIDPNSAQGQNPNWGSVNTLFTNLFSFLGGIDPASPNFDPIGAIINFITEMLNPTNLLAALVPNANQSGGVSGFIPMENLALDLISGVIGGAQSLIDAILQTVGVPTGTVDDIFSYFTDFLKMFGNPNLTSGSFNPITSIETFVVDLLQPTGLLAPLDPILGLLFPGNIPGMDASKITSGQFGTNMISGLEGAVTGLAHWVFPFLPVGSIGPGTPELLSNPNYAGAASVTDPSGVWTWDSAVDHTGDGSGSAKVTANGTGPLSLITTGTVPVGANQVLAISHWLQWTGVTAGAGQAFSLSLLAYTGTTQISTTTIASVSAPPASSGWQQISGQYTVPSGIDGVRLQISVDSSVKTGTIHWDDASMTAVNSLDQGLVGGLVGDISNLFSGLDARALATDLDSLLSALGLGSFTGVVDGIAAVVDRFTGIGSNGQMDASFLTNIENIPQLLVSAVEGIFGFGDIGSALQGVVDGIMGVPSGGGTVSGVNTKLSNISSGGGFDAGQLFNIANIPQLLFGSVGGTLGQGDIGSATTGIVDSIFSGLTGLFSTGSSLGNIANSLGSLVGLSTNAAGLAQTNAATTAKAAVSQPMYVGVDPSIDAVFPISNITGATPTTVNVTAGSSVIGMIGTPHGGIKEAIVWLGQTTTSITSMVLNVYSVNTSGGALSLIYSSPNIISAVNNALTWNYYDIPVANYITTAQGNWYAVEMQVLGTGTYQIVGLPGHWLPTNGLVYPKALGASRNVASGSVPPAPSSINPVNYDSDVPWFGLSGSQGQSHMVTAVDSFTSGSNTYTIPPWANYLDIVAVGGGGGGQGAGLFAGEGGHGGVWSGVTVALGTDIPRTTTKLTVKVGAGGAAGGGVGGNGGPGSASSVTGTGWAAGLHAGGGAGGSAANGDSSGKGPGNYAFNNAPYYGGPDQASGSGDGQAPGGGGAGAGLVFFTAGGAGAAGEVWISAYQ